MSEQEIHIDPETIKAVKEYRRLHAEVERAYLVYSNLEHARDIAAEKVEELLLRDGA